MDWRNPPTGAIRRENLLNALLAIWKTRQGTPKRYDLDDFSKGYEVGFEEGLDAIAQIAGLTEDFEAGKAAHQAKIKMKLNSQAKLIDGHATLVDTYQRAVEK